MTGHKEVSISCQEPLPKNSVSIIDCRFSSLSLVWLCRLISVMKCDMNLLICMQCQEESSNHVKQMRQLWNLAHTHFWQLSWLSFSLSCNLLVGIKSVIHGFVFREGDFFGVLLHGRKGGKGGGQMTMIHVSTHRQTQYCSIWMC